MCLGALRGEHSLKVARRARAGQTFPHSRRGGGGGGGWGGRGRRGGWGGGGWGGGAGGAGQAGRADPHVDGSPVRGRSRHGCHYIPHSRLHRLTVNLGTESKKVTIKVVRRARAGQTPPPKNTENCGDDARPKGIFPTKETVSFSVPPIFRGYIVTYTAGHADSDGV